MIKLPQPSIQHLISANGTIRSLSFRGFHPHSENNGSFLNVTQKYEIG